MTIPESQSIVRPIITAWERGDFSSAEGAHPRIEFVMADGREPGAWRRSRGMVTHLVVYWERARALADLSLAPEHDVADPPP